jgi:hypothetical protein
MKAQLVKGTVCVAAGTLALAAAGLLAGPLALAKPDPLPTIEALIAALDARVGRVETAVERVDGKVTALADRLEIQAKVHESVCAAGNIQCSDDGSGHTYDAASAANHNPVMLVVLVTRNGRPVTGLPSTSFFLNNNVLVAGGPVAVLCPGGGTGCGGGAGNLFRGFDDGTYMMFAHPGPAGVNWRAGSAFATVQVASGTQQAHTLVRIDIPPAP